MKKTFFLSAMLLASPLFFASCGSNKETPEPTGGNYVLCLGITTSSTTVYYAVTVSDLMSGTISPRNNGLEQTGYRDFEQGGQTIFSIGGLGVTNVNAITMDDDGSLRESGNFVFTQNLAALVQADQNNMLGMELPEKPADADVFKFYEVNINSAAITRTVERPVAPLAETEWPSVTGMCVANGLVYITYCQMNPVDWETAYTDTAYVAVYSYPDLQFRTVMKDTRTGPAGSWNAYNGIFKTENGDLCVMSNSSIANGYSQSTRKAAFLRIPKGTEAFDDYFFDFENKSGGLKPAHIQYAGNGLVFAEVSTNANQTLDDRWGDKKLKCCIIDLNAQTVTDITDIPVHDGNGGRRFTAMVDNGYVYYPVTTPEGVFIYQTDPKTAKAVKGAEVQTSFVAGFFKIK